MAPKGKDGIKKDGDCHCSYVSYKGKNIDGPIRQGPHAVTKAESDLHVLREANTSLATLQRAAAALKSAAAASETPADRIGRRPAIENQGGIEEEGDVRRARLAFERQNVRGPRGQGPHAATQANSDLQVLRTASKYFIDYSEKGRIGIKS